MSSGAVFILLLLLPLAGCTPGERTARWLTTTLLVFVPALILVLVLVMLARQRRGRRDANRRRYPDGDEEDRDV